MLNHGTNLLFSQLLKFLSLLIMASKFTRAQGPLSPPAPSSQAPLIVIGLVLSAFVIGLFYVFLCDADLHSFTFPTPSQFYQPTPRPLNDTALLSIPVKKYSEVNRNSTTEGEQKCAICLESFQENDLVRLIPHCSHIFHKHCIDECFKRNNICPVCRADLSRPVTEAPFLQEFTTSPNDELVPQPALQVTDSIIVVDQDAVEGTAELNWRWNLTGPSENVVASHRRGASLNYIVVDGETSTIEKFKRFLSAGQFSGQLGSFTRSLSRRWRGEEGSKRDNEEELQEQEQPMKPASYAGSLFRRERSSLSAREPLEVEGDFAV